MSWQTFAGLMFAAYCALAAAWQTGSGPRVSSVARVNPSAYRVAFPPAANAAASQSLADAAAADAAASLVGYDSFVRTNPRSDRFETKRFHHVELYCADATSAAARFSHALGMDLVARSDPPAERSGFTSLCVCSGEVRFVLSAPQVHELPTSPDALQSQFGFDPQLALAFMETHGGLAVRAVAIEVSDVDGAFGACVSGGGRGVLEPRGLIDLDGTIRGAMAEVALYGDTVLRLVSLDEGWDGDFLPGYSPVRTRGRSSSAGAYGVERIDHIVGNVRRLLPTVRHLKAMTGYHEFAEFTSEDVGTIDSGLNSMVLASNDERVLLPVNEPTYGTRRRSQIETYLVHHRGEGVQHIALFCTDIFETVAAVRAAAGRGGFSLMDPPSAEYYDELPARIGDALPAEDLERARELGLLVDRDDQGVLIQVFTRPLGDRPTLFLELIQRVGCMVEGEAGEGEAVQAGGCGGFGKGNFKELFKSVEQFERGLEGGEDAEDRE